MTWRECLFPGSRGGGSERRPGTPRSPPRGPFPTRSCRDQGDAHAGGLVTHFQVHRCHFSPLRQLHLNCSISLNFMEKSLFFFVSHLSSSLSTLSLTLTNVQSRGDLAQFPEDAAPALCWGFSPGHPLLMEGLGSRAHLELVPLAGGRARASGHFEVER